uniref:hypothetical protein n=1 Tax=Dialister sp. TaxID=1955814 RepID=UPI0040268682
YWQKWFLSMARTSATDKASNPTVCFPGTRKSAWPARKYSQHFRIFMHDSFSIAPVPIKNPKTEVLGSSAFD